MSFRVSFFSTQQSSKLGGWSENFWCSLSDRSATVTAGDTLRNALVALKGVQVSIPNYRVSSTTPPRNVLNVIVAGAAPGGTPTAATDADYPSTALGINLQGAGGYQSNQWIRGIPDQVVALSGTYQPGRRAGYTTAVNAFIAYLTNPANGWSLRCLDRTVLGTPISGIDYTTGIVTSPAHGLGAPGLVVFARIKGWSRYTPINKVWRCTVIDANTVQLSFWTVPPVGSGSGGNNPTLRLQKYILVPVQSASVVRATSHYTGRPTGLLGGRRKRRKTA